MGRLPFDDRAPRDYDLLIAGLVDFRNAYVEYLNATLEETYSGEGVKHTANRSRLLQLAVAAGEAVAASGVKVAVLPPPVAGGPPLVGLTNVAFAHEDPRFRVDPVLRTDAPKESFTYALDAVDSALAILQRRRTQVARQRRRPTYWIDRTLRAVLGFPAYLLSLIFGFDRRSLSARQARALWLLSVAADLAGIAALGVAMGWW